jgi:hypothetical protein
MSEKDYVHQPRASAETELVRAGNLAQNKEKSTFIEIGKDGIETSVENHQPKRSLEFNNAACYYLNDAAKYLCTHCKNGLDVQNKLYVMAELDRTFFFDITIGKFTEQYHRFMSSLSNVGDRKCYIPNGKSGYYIMSPFMLAFETENQEKLTESERRRLKNITQRGEVARKIAKVYLYFAKPLFEEYLTGLNRQYYKHPKNLYATTYDLVKNDIPSIQNRSEEDIPSHTEDIIRFIDYLYIHGAGDPNNKKLRLDVGKMCAEVFPQYTRRNELGRVRLHDAEKVATIITTAIMLCNKTDSLDYKISMREQPDLDYKSMQIILELEHPNAPKSKHLLSSK